MKKPAKDSKTISNLMKSLLGEGMARNKYTYFSKIAKKEGYEQIAAIFLETAENERAHAKRFYDFLPEELELVEINGIAYSAGINKSTLINLEYAAKGEHEENTFLYPTFAQIAEEEKYFEIADNYHEIIEAEKAHEQRYLALKSNIEENRVFKRDNEVIWKCRNCGYHFKGKEAPEVCPSCKHPIGYFELFVKNY